MLLATGACETATPSAAAGIVRTAVRPGVRICCGVFAGHALGGRPAWRALRLPARAVRSAAAPAWDGPACGLTARCRDLGPVRPFTTRMLPLRCPLAESSSGNRLWLGGSPCGSRGCRHIHE
jgi:hypothetical protein